MKARLPILRASAVHAFPALVALAEGYPIYHIFSALARQLARNSST